MRMFKTLIGAILLAFTLGSAPGMAASVASGLKTAGTVAVPAGAVEQVRHRRFGGFRFSFGGFRGGYGGYYGRPYYSGYGYYPRRSYYYDDYHYRPSYYGYRSYRHRGWDDDGWKRHRRWRGNDWDD